MEAKMPLQEIYYVAEMIVGVAVIISIVFVAIELRQNTYVTRKSMADGREQRLNWLMEQLATNEDFKGFSITKSNLRRLSTSWIKRTPSCGSDRYPVVAPNAQ